MGEWNPKVNELFLEALEQLLGPSRNAFIDDACNGDESLRAQVVAMLDANDRAADFLCSPLDGAQSPNGDFPRLEQPGSFVGTYKLLQEIGEGGMGIVYMAEQSQPVRRTVALKIVRPGMDSRQVAARFEVERQALALMDHPNIARVLDAGTTDTGRPFFVMELIKGVPITQYCDDHRLTPRQRLELFLPVCRAIQEAHQKGIIHRDLKPSNVMVAPYDGHPVPKVIDFGVAKAIGPRLTEHTLFTEFGAVIGTVEYMSPEQAELNQLDIDTRSDIYSLGVLLYELLVGTTPLERERHKGTSVMELLRQVREDVPPRPSTRLSTTEDLPTIAASRGTEPKKLSGVVRGELDWVVMKAMEKDRNRRYATASALADDIEHYLANEPVDACPPSAAYRVRVLVRQHKVAMAAAAGVAGALLLGTGVSTYMFLHERDALQRAVAAEGEAQSARAVEFRLRQQAEAQEQRALAEAAKSQQVAQFMKDMLDGVGSDVAQGRDTSLLRGIVDRTAERISQLETQPDVEVELRIILGAVYRDLAELEKAESMLRQAVDLARRHFGSEHGQVATALNHLALVLLSRHNFIEAEALHRKALAIRRKSCGESHPLVAESLDSLGLALHRQFRNAEAEPHYRQSLAIRRSVFGSQHEAVALSLSNLAVLLRVDGRLSESEPLHREALAIRRKLLGNDHPEVAISMNGLGNLLRDQGKLKDAEALHRESLAIRRKLYGEEHPYVAQSLNHLAIGLFWQGRFAEADELLDEALAIQQRMGAATAVVAADQSNEPTPDKADWYIDLSREGVRQGKFALAETAARKAIELQPENTVARRYLEVALARTTLSTSPNALTTLTGGAKDLLKWANESPQGAARAVESARSTDLAHQSLKPFERLLYGEYLVLGDEHERAIDAIRRAIDEAAAARKLQPFYYKSLGWALLSVGRRAEAAEALRQALPGATSADAAPQLAKADVDAWTAAYFLDQVTQDQFTQRWDTTKFAAMTWFYVGYRAELEGRADAALAAYGKSFTLAAPAGGNQAGNWSGYRLELLERRKSRPRND